MAGQQQNQDQGPGQDQPARIDDRVDRIEAEQQRQGGMLERLMTLVDDKKNDSGPDQEVTRGDPPPDADMAEQMRQAVRDVNAEATAAATRAAHDADHEKLRRPPAEQPPREAMVRGKDKLQRAFFGTDPGK